MAHKGEMVSKKDLQRDHEEIVGEKDKGRGFLSQEEIEQEREAYTCTWERVKEEAKEQFNIAGPTAAMNIMWFGRMVASAVFLGRQGQLSLAGGTLAMTLANVTGFSVLTGLAGGMEAVCSQAFGAGNYGVVGATLYRAIFMLGTTSVPVALLWWNVQAILMCLHVDRDIANVAAMYLRYLIPDLAATSVMIPLRIYLRSQCITKPMTVCTAAAVICHVALNVILQRFGVAGIASALGLSDLIVVATIAAYVAWKRIHVRTHQPGWWRSGGGWRTLLGLSGATCVMTCLEWWCYEILVLLTGRLPNATEALSVLAIVLNADQLLYSVMISLAACASTRVGIELGKSAPRSAFWSAKFALAQSVVAGALGAAAMLAVRGQWAALFIGGEKAHGVRRVAERAMCVMAVIQVFNFPLMVAGGVLRGTAKPSMAVYLNMLGFYVLGLPLGAGLAFGKGMGVVGLLLGLSFGVGICCALAVALVLLGIDWRKQALVSHCLTQLSPVASCSSRQDQEPKSP